VYAVPNYERMLYGEGLVVDVPAIARDAEARDRVAIRTALGDKVPEELVAGLEIRAGRPPVVLRDAAAQLDAGLIVIGSRRHTGLDRLMARMARYLVRATDIPLLVTNGSSPVIRRVLVALDLSYASMHTWETAVRWARLFDAQLRALHVLEPAVPMAVPDAPWSAPDISGTAQRSSKLWDRIPLQDAEKVVRVGTPAQAIAEEAADWQADLVVVGSHGAGWGDRLLIGSTAELLVCQPPAMTLVVPSGHPAADESLGIEALPWEEREALVTG